MVMDTNIGNCNLLSFGINYRTTFLAIFSKWKMAQMVRIEEENLTIYSDNSLRSGPWFNIKMSSYQYRKSHCGDKTILRPSYLHNGISYTGKMTSLYWIGALVIYNPILPLKRVSALYDIMMTSTNGNIFRVTGPLCAEFTGLRWIPRTKASDAELWCFLWSASE